MLAALHPEWELRACTPVDGDIAFAGCFLEPLSAPTEIVIEAAMKDERAADACSRGVPHPDSLVPALSDIHVARAIAGRCHQ